MSVMSVSRVSLAHPNLKPIAAPSFLIATILLLLGAAVLPAHAQFTQSNPYEFCSLANCADGAASGAGLIMDTKGNLYGTTVNGGNTSACVGQAPPGCGVVFELAPPASGNGPWTQTILHTFTGGSDGANPYAGLVLDSKGNLYGTTAYGGNTSGSNCSAIGGCGVVFELTPPAGMGQWTENVIFTFDGNADGGAPFAGVIFYQGNLYGTTAGGGQGYGVVFELSPPSGGSGHWTETPLYQFTGLNDGDTPYAGVIPDSNGNLYGTTLQGGYYGYGVVYEVSPSGGETTQWIETDLYQFEARTDGGFPYAGVIFDTNGNLYGTTSIGGDTSGTNCKSTRGCGVAFELNPSPGASEWIEHLLYTFTGSTDGGYPEASLIFDTNGNLYGTAIQGGDVSGANCSGTSGCGAVFELTPDGTYPWTVSQPYTFQGGSDGSIPYAGVIFDTKGNIYGTTSSGGNLTPADCDPVGGCGTVFELTPEQAGAVTITPTSLKFGNQIIDTTSSARTVTLTNNGPGTLDISSITVTPDFAISSKTCGSQLAVHKSCKVSVTFTPTQLGAVSGTLSFADNAPNSPQMVPLSGTGIAPVTLSPASENFGKQKVGTTSKPKKFDLTNNQSAELTGISISATGDFQVSSTTCGTTLAAKKSCSISVTFTPTEKGTRTGELQVTDSASNSPQTSSLTGTGD